MLLEGRCDQRAEHAAFRVDRAGAPQADWYALMSELGQIEPEEGAPIYGGAYDGEVHPNGETPNFCTHSCADAVAYCDSHAMLKTLTDDLLHTGSVEDARQACDLWRGEILSLYELWLNLMQKSGKADTWPSISIAPSTSLRTPSPRSG